MPVFGLYFEPRRPETTNGCICCTVRGDLVRIIDGLMRRKRKFATAVEDGEERVSRIVFIGRALPEEAIRERFEACVA